MTKISDEALRKDWYPVFCDARKLILNHDKVNRKLISERIQKCMPGILNRMYCLVAWQEVKRINADSSSLLMEQYDSLFTEAWRFFRAHASDDESEEYWDDVLSGIITILEKYDHCQFVKDLMIYTVLEELERIHAESRKQFRKAG